MSDSRPDNRPGNRTVKRVLIVGGGTAGWMCAAALTRMLDTDAVDVRLVESEQIGTVGVGEATLPGLADFNRMLGIREADFMAQTSATIKYGIEFVNWTQDGERYFHPFGTHGADLDGLPFHQYWLRLREQGDASRIEDYCITATAALEGTATAPARDPKSLLSRLSHAYQMDAALYARFLRRYAEERGLARIEGRVTGVDLDSESGFVSAVALDDGRTLEADLFIDCTGFRALLLGQALGVDYQSWAHWLPVDSAWTAQTTRGAHEKPYTRCTAKEAGWQWRIPLQHRVGNGHVYSSRFMDDDAALHVFRDGLDDEPVTEPRNIKFTTGRRARFWDRNVVSLGLSGGFLEPLESTSIYLIQAGIKLLVSLWPGADCPPVEQDEFNTLMGREFEQIRDFLLLHYVANERHGEPFWDHFRTLTLPDSLARKIELFREGGRVFRYDGDLFSDTSWVAVFLGQNIIPQRHSGMVDAVPTDRLQQSLDGMRKAVASTARAMPRHEDFLAKAGATYRDAS